MPRDRERRYGTDRLETVMPAGLPRGLSWNGSQPVVVLDELVGDEIRLFDELPDEDLNASDVDFELAGEIHEIPMSDAFEFDCGLLSPELGDSNLPGAIDIEELDEHALDFTSLPADARLDPLEE